MKVAAMFGDMTGGLVQKPDPIPKEDFVLVKVHAAPMCTEYKALKGGHEGSGFGHEAAGEVVEVAQPGRVKVGDRVVVQPQYACGTCPSCLVGEHIHCRNGRNVLKITGSSTGTATFAQYLLKQDWLLSPIPDGVSYEHAGMGCCGMGPTFGAMQQMQVNALDTVLITGLGPVGLGGVANGHYRGARVIGVESHPYRANLAKELGADVVLDPNDEDVLEQIMDLTNGVGVDKAMDCSGASQAHRLMVDALRRKGQACFIGEGGEFPLGASRDMIRKGLVLRGNWHYNLGDYPKLMKVIEESAEQLDKFITHTFPMSQVQKAWELQITGECGKVVLNPWA
ncbi:zinc-binding dehydrogenase [Candidatus Poribacteria bacterium]|nr:zinc-binding dehydrogenase [Candidatus Poribacteria bacterium]